MTFLTRLLCVLCGFSTNDLVAGIARQPSSSHDQARRQLRVYVQDFLDVNESWKLPALNTLALSMSDIYGEPRCPGDPYFIKLEDAPRTHCQSAVGARALRFNEDHVEFDQYAMESIMLGKWLKFAGRCHEEVCAQSADIVVVPSLLFHRLAASRRISWDIVSSFRWSTQVHEPWIAHLAGRYWSLLREKYFQPGRSWPLLLVHSGFANHLAQDFFLADQPAQMQSRIVLASLEGNLDSRGKAMTYGALGNNPASALARLLGESPREAPTRPLMLTLPYPVSLLTPSKFTWVDGAYDPARPRKIALSLFGTPRFKTPSCWIRKVVIDRLQKSHAIAESPEKNGTPSTHICAWTGSGSRAKKRWFHRHTRFCGVESPINMWSLAVNTIFCIEPAGDTLTRSHLYVSILSGCVPVIFDGGHDRYDDATFWPWRGLNETEQKYPFTDYSKFAVVYNSSDVLHGRVDFIQELLEMPHKDPQRLAKLRAELDHIAPRMTYALHSDGSGDAFEATTFVLRRMSG